MVFTYRCDLKTKGGSFREKTVEIRRALHGLWRGRDLLERFLIYTCDRNKKGVVYLSKKGLEFAGFFARVIDIRPAGTGSGGFQVLADRAGSGRVGSGRVELGWVGSGRVGSGRVGSGRVGSGRVGSGRVGSGRVRSVRVGSGRVGSRGVQLLLVSSDHI